MADIPQEQAQENVEISLTNDGNILLYGSPGYGKTSFLQSAAMDLARNYSPADLTMYLLDFGTNGLAPLSKLPHVADTLLLDQTEKIEKFVRIMERELNRRKKLLSDYGVGTMALYREAAQAEEPTIVILLDSYESMKDEPFEPELFKLLMRISREGLSIGVHLIITAGRQSNLRATLYANFKHQLTLKQNDVGEIRTIVGSTPLANTMEDIKGRILMKRNQVDVVQLALPVSGTSDIQIIQNLRDEVQTLQDAWTGQRPSAIPMVPEELTVEEFMGMPSTNTALKHKELPIGVELEDVQTVSLPLNRLRHILLLSDKEESMRTATRHMVNTLIHSVPANKITIFDPIDEYSQFASLVHNFAGYESDIRTILDELKEQILSARKRRDSFDHYILITEMGQFVAQSNLEPNELALLIEEGQRVGLHFIFAAQKSFMTGYTDIPKYMRTHLDTAVIAMRMSDQTIYTRSQTGKEDNLPVDQVYLHYQGTQIKLKITR